MHNVFRAAERSTDTSHFCHKVIVYIEKLQFD